MNETLDDVEHAPAHKIDISLDFSISSETAPTVASVVGGSADVSDTGDNDDTAKNNNNATDDAPPPARSSVVDIWRKRDNQSPKKAAPKIPVHENIAKPAEPAGHHRFRNSKLVDSFSAQPPKDNMQNISSVRDGFDEKKEEEEFPDDEGKVEPSTSVRDLWSQRVAATSGGGASSASSPAVPKPTVLPLKRQSSSTSFSAQGNASASTVPTGKDEPKDFTILQSREEAVPGEDEKRRSRISDNWAKRGLNNVSSPTSNAGMDNTANPLEFSPNVALEEPGNSLETPPSLKRSSVVDIWKKKSSPYKTIEVLTPPTDERVSRAEKIPKSPSNTGSFADAIAVVAPAFTNSPLRGEKPRASPEARSAPVSDRWGAHRKRPDVPREAETEITSESPRRGTASNAMDAPKNTLPPPSPRRTHSPIVKTRGSVTSRWREAVSGKISSTSESGDRNPDSPRNQRPLDIPSSSTGDIGEVLRRPQTLVIPSSPSADAMPPASPGVGGRWAQRNVASPSANEREISPKKHATAPPSPRGRESQGATSVSTKKEAVCLANPSPVVSSRGTVANRWTQRNNKPMDATAVPTSSPQQKDATVGNNDSKTESPAIDLDREEKLPKPSSGKRNVAAVWARAINGSNDTRGGDSAKGQEFSYGVMSRTKTNPLAAAYRVQASTPKELKPSGVAGFAAKRPLSPVALDIDKAAVSDAEDGNGASKPSKIIQTWKQRSPAAKTVPPARLPKPLRVSKKPEPSKTNNPTAASGGKLSSKSSAFDAWTGSLNWRNPEKSARKSSTPEVPKPQTSTRQLLSNPRKHLPSPVIRKPKKKKQGTSERPLTVDILADIIKGAEMMNDTASEDSNGDDTLSPQSRNLLMKKKGLQAHRRKIQLKKGSDSVGDEFTSNPEFEDAISQLIQESGDIDDVAVDENVPRRTLASVSQVTSEYTPFRAPSNRPTSSSAPLSPVRRSTQFNNVATNSPRSEANNASFLSDCNSVHSGASSSLTNRAERALQQRRKLQRGGKHPSKKPVQQQLTDQVDPRRKTSQKQYRNSNLMGVPPTAVRSSKPPKPHGGAPRLSHRYNTASRFMDPRKHKSHRQSAVSQQGSTEQSYGESLESSFHSLDTGTTESDSHCVSQFSDGSRAVYNNARNGRRSASTPTIASDKFLSANASNFDAFQRACKGFSLREIASDWAGEINLLGLDKIASQVNEKIKKVSETGPKNCAALRAFDDEDVAIEVEFMEEDSEFIDDEEDDPHDDDGGICATIMDGRSCGPGGDTDCFTDKDGKNTKKSAYV